MVRIMGLFVMRMLWILDWFVSQISVAHGLCTGARRGWVMLSAIRLVLTLILTVLTWLVTFRVVVFLMAVVCMTLCVGSIEGLWRSSCVNRLATCTMMNTLRLPSDEYLLAFRLIWTFVRWHVMTLVLLEVSPRPDFG